MPRPMALLLWLLVREALGLEPVKNLASMTSEDIAHRDLERHTTQPSKPVAAPVAATAFARAEPRGRELPRAAEGRVEAVVPAKGVEWTALAETHSKQRSMNDCETECTSTHDAESDGLKACKEKCQEEAATTAGSPEFLEKEKALAASGQVKCMECRSLEAKGEDSNCDEETLKMCKNLLDNGMMAGAEFEKKKLQKLEDAAEADMADGNGAYGVCAGIVVAWALTL